ncbi:hypothetical protein QRN89_21495 [Streptomyces chengbuensis]|uniref:hypothetical protein n=1 Tax=Streptomyces chengbuensis TaxID=3053466 RepID=UPI0025B5DCD0|nr:hypothetical protein [Streptomyces sp. HUAS CB01]WJY52144.1 hypothetical protein QRN89_21495 [Streptomyces sp. HUAS CB01]
MSSNELPERTAPEKESPAEETPAEELAELSGHAPAENTAPEAETTEGSPDRRGLLIAAAVLLACGGLVGYGVLNAKEQPKPRAVPTAGVTYEVTGTGTAEIAYLARSESGTATVEKDVTLPWKKSVEVPLGKAPSVAIVLDQKGGRASCTLAIRGQHVQRATAVGEFGRATCSGELPAAGAGEG